MKKKLSSGYATRWAVLTRDSFTCQYCGQFAPNVMLEVDHRIARCEGGSDDMSNLVTACIACNRGKEAYRAGVHGHARGMARETKASSIRARLPDVLRDGPLAIDVLARRLGMHVNTVRKELLAQDGVLWRCVARESRRGPSSVWELLDAPVGGASSRQSQFASGATSSLVTRPASVNDLDWRMYQRRQEGRTLAEVAEEFGVSQPTVYRRMRSVASAISGVPWKR